MIGRLAALAAGVAAAAGAAIWAGRKADRASRRGRKRRAARAADGRRRGAGGGARNATADQPRASGAVRPAAPDPGLAAPEAPGDSLTSLKGVGSVSAARLRDMGVTTFAQIAAWSDDDVEAVAAVISVSPERIRREDWVGQAKARGEPPE